MTAKLGNGSKDFCRCPHPSHSSVCSRVPVWRCKQTGVQLCADCMEHYGSGYTFELLQPEAAK